VNHVAIEIALANAVARVAAAEPVVTRENALDQEHVA
jgi:hypothetical protein